MNKVIDLIKKANSVVILAHDSEDADAVGSSFAARLALLGMGKDVQCVFSETPEERIRFLGDDYKVFDESDIPEADLCLCLDCGDVNRIGKRKAIFEKAKTTACIDHHHTNVGFCDADFIDSKAPATGEILYNLFIEMGVEITKDIARELYAAISSDTGSFKYSNVRPETFLIASELIKKDIDHAEIARKLFDTENLKTIKFKGHLMNSLEQYFDGKLNIVMAPDSLISEYGIEEKDTGDIVNIPRAVKGCEIAVSIREAKEKNKISFRSNGKYDVSKLAEKFGGGGHIMAAGAAFRSKTIDQVKEEVIKYCEEIFNG